MLGWIAEIFGATIGFLLFGGLVAGSANKLSGEGFDSPEARAMKTTLVAWVVIGAIATYGHSDGYFAWWAPLLYIPGALILWRVNLRRYRQREKLAETFQ